MPYRKRDATEIWETLFGWFVIAGGALILLALVVWAIRSL